MTVEVRPLGVKCNIQCQYCYQDAQRDTGAVIHRYDLESMMRALKKHGRPFTVFGGEPLLLPIADLERIWTFGFERFGRNSVQTNGVLLEATHIELFKRLNVHVGISIDGPDDLNDVRWAGSISKTRQATAKTEASISRLCEAGMPPSLIVTLHRGNAAREKLDRMHKWLLSLENIGIRSVRFHLLEIDNPSVRNRYALSSDENVNALQSLLVLETQLKTMEFPLFDDMRNMLQGKDERTSCIWNACDPYTTSAVQGIEGNGQLSNCGRTNKEGIDFAKSDTSGFERYIGLYQTPQDSMGCAGCSFFLMCKGQCPGTAFAGDWRNRTEHCEVWKAIYSQLEAELISAKTWVLSRSRLRSKVERALLQHWLDGKTAKISPIVRRLKKTESEASIVGTSVG